MIGRIGRRARACDGPVAVAFVLWAVAPIAALVAIATIQGGSWGGAESPLTGADQYRFLAWIRDAGEHGLISDRFGSGSGGHVYLHPMFLISGLAWRLGASLQVAYLLWLPVALAVLLYGFWAYLKRTVEPGGGGRRAALALALFYFTPLLPALDYGGAISADAANYLVVTAGEGAAYWQAWGYLPTTLALGLMPLYVLGIERLLPSGEASRQPVSRRGPGGVAAAGLAVSWLYPWGGLTLLVFTLAIGVSGRRSRARAVVFPALGIAVPLIYLWLLGRSDPAWSLAELEISYDPARLWVSLAALGPLVALAGAGVRRTPRRWGLVAWPLSALAVYLLLGRGARLEVIAGAMLPLAVLAVDGWRRLRFPISLGVGALLIAILPGALYSVHTLYDFARTGLVPYILRPDEVRALRHVEASRTAGGVLPTPYLGSPVPAFTGRWTWMAFHALAPEFEAREDTVSGLFAGQLPLRRERALVSESGARFLMSGCEGHKDLIAVLRPLGFEVRRFECATVYERR